MSERREVRGWVVPSFWVGVDAVVCREPHPKYPEDPVVIRHAEDDAALLEELERLRKLTGESRRLTEVPIPP